MSQKKNERRVPKLRFKGFTDDWMQEKLKSHATFSKGKGYKKNDLVPYGYPIILYGELYTNYREFITEVNTFVKDDKNSVKSIGQEVIIPSSGESPEDIARASSVKARDIILGGDLNIIYPDKNISPDFLALTLSNGKAKRELTSKAQGSSITHLYNSDIKKIDISFPSLDEQSKITEMVKLLNSVITLEQEKLDLLRTLKQYLLRSMYINEGIFPTLRFKGFSEPWIQTKVKKISEKQIGGGTPSTKVDEYWEGDIPWLQSSDLDKKQLFNIIPEKFININAVDNSSAKIIKKGSISVVTRVGVGKVAYIPYEYTTSQDFMSLQDLTIAPLFGTYLISQLMKKLSNQTQGTSIKGITNDQLLSSKVFIPHSKTEQQQIGNTIKKLDEIILFKRTKLESVNKIKQSLLNLLFI